MCPNCILNQVGIQTGIYVAFGVCAVFFVLGIAGILWAFKNGEFEDMESSKFDMMDDDLNGALGQRARTAADTARLKSGVNS